MAGAYPDVPDNRMLLDRDGSGIFVLSGGSRTALTSTDIQKLNDEASTGVGPDTTASVDSYLVVFPELRDVTGLFLCFVPSVLANWVDVTIEASSDTTNGIDGTWHTVFATSRVYDGTAYGIWGKAGAGAYRQSIQTTTYAAGVKALRLSMNAVSTSAAWTLTHLHVYGKVAASVDFDRLVLWHPTLNQRVGPAYFDWGNVAQGSAAERQFRVKNLSSTMIASGITVNTDALTDSTPSFPRQLYLAYAGGSYAASCSVPALFPLAVSGLITMRRVTPSAAAASLWAARVFADVTTWSTAGV